MSDREKVKKYVETSNGQYTAPDGRAKPTDVATAKFDTEAKATSFMEELERLRVCCSPNGSDFTMVYFHENILAGALA